MSLVMTAAMVPLLIPMMIGSSSFVNVQRWYGRRQLPSLLLLLLSLLPLKQPLVWISMRQYL
jgi:hypothetical protein